MYLNPCPDLKSFDENSTYFHLGNLNHLEINRMFISTCYTKDWFSYWKITNVHDAFLGTIEKQREFCNNGGYRTKLGLRMEKELKREKNTRGGDDIRWGKFTAKHIKWYKCTCASWTVGDDILVSPFLSNEVFPYGSEHPERQLDT